MTLSTLSRRVLFMVLPSLAILASSAVGNRAEQRKAPTLDSLKLEFDVQRAEVIKPVMQLRESYEDRLKELLKEVTKTGDLEKALAVQNELTNYQSTDASADADNEALFSELKRLREIFLKSQAQRLNKVNEKLVPLAKAYKANLSALQKQLTKDNKLEEAIAVQTARKEVKETLSLAEIPKTPTGMKAQPEAKFSIVGKTASFPHPTNPDFTVRVQFADEGKATWIGLGNHAVPWTYEASGEPLEVFIWSHTQNGSKERGMKIVLDADRKTGVVSRTPATTWRAAVKISETAP